MKTNSEILDQLGKIIVCQIIDRYYSGVSDAINNGFKHPPKNIYNEIFNKLTHDERKILINFNCEIINSVIFDILEIFESNETFKLYYEDDEQKINVAEISEMLKAEPLGENGWIERFSKFSSKNIENQDNCKI